jgi:beta-phosphoglucomutase
MADSLGVIFDIDGVLVDSSQAHFRSWQALADVTDCQKMTESQFRVTFGRTTREILAELWPEAGLSETRIAELDDQKETLFREILARDFPEMPGAGPLIDSLHDAGFLLAAGSSGPPKNVNLVLEQLGRRSHFQAVVTGTDVDRGKPDPQVFLVCAERLGLPPRHCAVIEDAAAGIAAANAAGMLSVGFMSHGHRREEYADAAQFVERLSDLSPATLREWIRA